MIGIIVTGHGRFADGITSALEVISGAFPAYAAVDFPIEMSREKLEADLRTAIKSLHYCETILVCADLVGGSPFNVACELKLRNEQVMEVVGGVNFPFVLEACMTREHIVDLRQLIEQLIHDGKEQIVKFEVQDFSDEIDE